MTLRDEGLYRVTEAEVAGALGVSTAAVRAMSLRVENLGRAVPSLRDGGDLVFHGRAHADAYTDENVYWIVEGAPAAVAETKAKAAKGAPATSFEDVVRLERQLVLRSDLFEDPGEDLWLWSQVIGGLRPRFETKLDLPGLLEGSGGEIVVDLKGASKAAGQSAHAARVELNGQALGRTVFEGLQAARLVAPAPDGLWREADNTLAVIGEPPEGTRFDTFYIDRIEARYARRFEAVDNRLTLRVPAGAVRITGFERADVEVWEVADGHAVARLTRCAAEADGERWAIAFQAPRAATYAACARGSELKPLAVTTARRNDLKDPDLAVDYLVVAGPGLEDAAAALADVRAAQGLAAKVVGIEQVYDAFNHGVRDARALHAMLAHARAHWARAPRYVALVGKGSLDYRDFLGRGGSLVPALPQGSVHGVYASDHGYGDTTGDGALDMAVGRIPVADAEELAAYVAKVRTYEAGGPWRDRVLVATDDRDRAGIYISDGRRIAARIRTAEARTVEVETHGRDAVREALMAGVDGGSALVIYIGHGSLKGMGEEGLLKVSDVASFTNAASSVVVGAFGCLMGAFGLPGQRGLGESLIANAGGAVAVVASSGMVGNADSCDLAEALVIAVYEHGAERLGDAWIEAKEVLTRSSRLPAAAAYQLLGDPALSVHSAP